MDALVSTNCVSACEGISCYITSLPCASSHTGQPVCWRAMSTPQAPHTWYQGAGKKSWCRVMQFLHVDALCRLCSCATVVLHTHTFSTTRAHGPPSPPTQPHPRENPHTHTPASAAAVCGTFQRFDLREKFQNMTDSVLTILVVPSQIDSLKSVLSHKIFSLNTQNHTK